MITNEKEPDKSIRVDVDPELKKAFKVKLIEVGLTQTEFIINSISEFVSNKPRKRSA